MEDCQMGYDPMRFWYQIYALHLFQESNPHRFGGWVCWIPIKREDREAGHGWKISWRGLLTRTFILEGICWWCSESKRIWSGASSDISWEDYNWEILKIGLLDNKQWNWVWGSVGTDDHGLENEGKRIRDILRFEVGCRLGKWGVRGQGCENARIFESG